jgi:hypothetical protein
MVYCIISQINWCLCWSRLRLEGGVLVEQFGVLVFELGDYVFIEEEGGDCGVFADEVLVETCLLEASEYVHVSGLL